MEMFISRTMFAVLEFYGTVDEDDHEVAVVPLHWLHKNEKKCYWPERIGKGTDFTAFVKENPPCKKTWPSYKVFRVHFKSEDYDVADKRASNIISELSESEADASSSTTRSLSRKRINENQPFPLEVKRSRIEKTDDALNESISGSSRASSVSTVTISSDFEETVLDNITKLTQHIEQHTIILNELVRNSRSGHMVDVQPPGAIPTFPLGSLESFKEFDAMMREEEEIPKYLITRLAAVGGSGLESVTRRILKFLITDEVASNYNWKGRDKLSFEKTFTMSMVYEAANRNFPKGEKNDLVVANSVKDWLKHASTRLKRARQ